LSSWNWYYVKDVRRWTRSAPLISVVLIELSEMGKSWWSAMMCIYLIDPLLMLFVTLSDSYEKYVHNKNAFLLINSHYLLSECQNWVAIKKMQLLHIHLHKPLSCIFKCWTWLIKNRALNSSNAMTVFKK